MTIAEKQGTVIIGQTDGWNGDGIRTKKSIGVHNTVIQLTTIKSTAYPLMEVPDDAQPLPSDDGSASE